MAENSFKKQVDQAKADIRAIKEEFKELDAKMIETSKIARSMGPIKISSPDGLNNLIKDLDSTMTKLNKTLEQQTQNSTKLISKKKKLAALNAKEKVDSAALARDAKLHATATSKLVGAYDRLNAKRKIASRNLRNLIASEKASNSEIKKAQREFDLYTAKINKANKATSNFSKGSLGGMVRGFRNLFGAFGVVGGATLIASLTSNILKLTKEIEGLNFALKSVTKNQEEFLRVQFFLEDISQRYGASLITTTQRYTKFLVAAKQSNVSLKDTEEIFETVTKASGVLGLKTDELTGVYLALEQMLSKGKVTTEELRRQLGERLPGAFGIMANALGVTTSQLDKMLRKGEVLSSVALPKFAKELEKALSIENVRNIDTLIAAQSRLENSWLLLVKSIEGGEGKISSAFKSVFNFVSGAINILTKFNETFEDNLNIGGASGYKVALEGVSDEVKRMNGSIKEAAESLIPRYENILNSSKKTLGELNKEQSKSMLNNAINVITGKFAENERRIKRAGHQIGVYTKALETLKKIAETGKIPPSEIDAPEKDEKDKSGDKLNSKRGSLQYLKDRIKIFEEEREKLATNTNLYKGYTMAIEQLKETLSELEGEYEFATISGGKVETSVSTGSRGSSESELFKITQKAKEKALEKFKEKALKVNEEIREDQEEKSKEEARRLQEKMEAYKEVFNTVIDSFSEIFDIDVSKFDFLFDGLKNSVSDWADLSKELIGSVLDASLNKYEVELQEAQRVKDLVVQNDLATDKQKRLAEERFDKEERRIKNRRAKQERKNTLIKIAVDTAAAVVKTLVDAGPLLAPAIIPTVIGIGLAQAAIVASQPLPKFAEGHLSGTHSGKALINDAKRSNYKEVVERKDGQLEIYKNRNQIIDMKKGDKVHKSTDSFLTYHNIERDVLNMSIMSHKEQLMMNDNEDKLYVKIDEMKSLFASAADKMEAIAKRPIKNHNHIIIEQPYNEY